MSSCWLFKKKSVDFGNNFIDCNKILLTNQESCIINGGSTKAYFSLEEGGRQGDQISAYLFLIALEIVYPMIKNNSKTEGLTFSIVSAFILRT